LNIEKDKNFIYRKKRLFSIAFLQVDDYNIPSDYLKIKK